MLKFENGVIVDLTPEEESAVKEYQKRKLQRPLEPHEVFNLLSKSIVNNVSVISVCRYTIPPISYLIIISLKRWNNCHTR